MPEEYSLQTSIAINAPAKKVFDVMLDLTRFDEWNPFRVMDPTSVSTVTQKKPGVGSTYDYVGKRIGRGRMLVTEASRPSVIVEEMTFYNRKTETARVEFRLVEEAAGTLVTWSMTGTRGLGGRLMTKLLNLDKMMGKTFAQGLEKLKTLVESGK